jgi:phage virion morphogenesis protein
MSAQIDVRLQDLGVSDTVAAMIAAGEDMTPAMRDIGASLVTSTVRRFEIEEGPDGSPWPKSVRALAEGGQTLTESARLRQSITYIAAPSSVEVGTDVAYAGVHQDGKTIKPVSAQALTFRIGAAWVTAKEVTIPARPFLGIDEADEAEIGAILTDHVGEAAQ